MDGFEVDAGSALKGEPLPLLRRVRLVGSLAVAALLLMAVFAGVARASSVTNVMVTNAPTDATSAPTVYKTSFTATTALSGAQNATVTVTFPAITGLSDLTNEGTVTDNSESGQPEVGGDCSNTSGTTETCDIFNGSTVNPGDTVTVELDGVVNPSRASSGYVVDASTSADMTPVPSNAFTVANAQSVSNVTFTDSPPTNATSAPTVYKTTFTTSSTGGMSGAAGSTITLVFPSGTGLGNLTNEGTVTDNTTSGHPEVGGDCSNTSGTTEICIIFNGSTVNPGDSVTVELDGVINPSTVLSPTGAPYSMSVSTTSDHAIAAVSNTYALASAQSVSNVTVTNSPPTTATSAPTVYKTTFTTSSTGGMSGAAGSTISLEFPSGTGLTHLTNQGIVTDNTTSGSPEVGGDCNTIGRFVTCIIFNGSTVNPGDSVTVELDGVINPSTVLSPTGAPYSMSVSTTSDNASAVASNTYTVASAQSVSNVMVTNSPPTTAAGAPTVYKTTFTTSSTGGMSGAAGSTITLVFPSGTGLGNLTNEGTVTDNTTSGHPEVGGDCSNPSGTTETCIIFNGDSVNAGDSVTVELDAVVNPSPTTTATASVSTTSDHISATASSDYTVLGQHPVTSVSVGLSNSTPGAGGVTYKVGFTSSATGGMSGAAGSTITLVFPSGTGLRNLANAGVVTDNTTSGHPEVGGDCANPSGTTETCIVFGGSSVNPGDSVTVELDGVTNPTTPSTSDMVVVSTTSDQASVDSAPYGIGSPAVTGISPTSGPTGGGTSVTISGTSLAGATSVKFGTASATNVTVVSSSQITATSPAGSAATVDVTVTTPGGTSATGDADQFTYSAPAQPSSPPPASPPSSPPAVSGGSPMTETVSGAAVSGTVNPESLATTAYFQYGLDPSDRGPGASTTLYDQSTPVQQVGSDSASHTVSASLTGLVPGALYHVRLVATNSAGTTFGTDQTFTTPQAPTPAPPVLGKTENAAPVTGTVFIKAPSGAFVLLTGSEQIPSGAEIDALHGSLKITTATAKKGKTQQGVFGGAVFTFTQTRAGASKGLATLSLVEAAFSGAPSYAICKPHKALDATAASSKTLQLLHASAHGKFRTKGRYSAATVLGTKWTIADRCDGTLVHDVTDSVAVTDFVRHKTIILHAGQSYLAKASK